MKISTVRFRKTGRTGKAFLVVLGALFAACALDGCSGDNRSLSEDGPDGAAGSGAEGGAGSGGRRSSGTDAAADDGGLPPHDDASGPPGTGGEIGYGGENAGGAAGSAGSAGTAGQTPSGGGMTSAGGTASGGASAGGGGSGGSGGSTSTCGNGKPDPGEECDDGNNLEDDNCALCTDRHDCLSCLADQCDVGVTPGCSRFTNADEKAACESVYACVARTECVFEKTKGAPDPHLGGNVYCWCGNADIAACRAGTATGPCHSEIDAVFKKYHGDLQVTDSGTLINNIGVVTYPHAAALALWQCASTQCGENPGDPDTYGPYVCSPDKHPKPSGAGGAGTGGVGTGGVGTGGVGTGGVGTGGVGTGGVGTGGVGTGGTNTNTGGTNTGGTNTNTGGTNTGGTSTGGTVSYCSAPQPTPVADPALCSDCEQTFCDAPVAPGCDRFAAGSAERTQCTDVLACIRSTNCINQGNVKCYCGSTPIVECKASAAAATGACKDRITAAFPPGSNASAIVNNIATLTIPGGAALALGQCDFSFCGELQSFECVPYCQ